MTTDPPVPTQAVLQPATPQASQVWADAIADASASAANTTSQQGELDQATAYIRELECKIRQLQASSLKQESETEYAAVVRRIRSIVDVTLPATASLLVISKGDPQLLNLSGRSGGHFPQTSSGAYAGSYPANGADAVSQLEVLRGSGTEYLLIPSSSFWWLEHYAQFREHLGQQYPVVAYVENVCLIYRLRRPEQPAAPTTNGR